MIKLYLEDTSAELPGHYYGTFPYDICNGCQNRKLSPRTPGPVPFGTCICSNGETNGPS